MADDDEYQRRLAHSRNRRTGDNNRYIHRPIHFQDMFPERYPNTSRVHRIMTPMVSSNSTQHQFTKQQRSWVRAGSLNNLEQGVNSPGCGVRKTGYSRNGEVNSVATNDPSSRPPKSSISNMTQSQSRGTGSGFCRTGDRNRYIQRPAFLNYNRRAPNPGTSGIQRMNITPNASSNNIEHTVTKEHKSEAKSHGVPDLSQGANSRGYRVRAAGHCRGGYVDSERDQRSSKGVVLNKMRLQSIAEMGENVLISVYSEKTNFMALFKSNLNGPEGEDTIVLLVKIIALLNQSTYERTKKKLILELEISESGFLEVLTKYLLDLPENRVESNPLYWQNQVEFWNNFLEFCECLIETSSGVATNNDVSETWRLLEDTAWQCVEQLRATRGLFLPFETWQQMEALYGNLKREREEPGSFRELSVVPRSSDLMNQQRFLRPNIIEGCYYDVEHYLDVQFRLLREDCYGPLRDGILQYLSEPRRKKYDNIRVHHNVTFVGPYVSDNKIGSIIQLDRSANKFLRKVNWVHSKRFIHGSLLLLTKDNCNSFVVCTILDREIRYIERGQIPVLIIGDDNDIHPDDSYTMIESEVYFEPYLHVLNALRNPKLSKNFAMAKYIVNVDPNPTHPAYILQNTEFSVAKNLQVAGVDFVRNKSNFTVLNNVTWPHEDFLGLNVSQYQAYHLALTREFAVIQGPPGTGKTFLGAKVAQTLLLNLKENKGAKLLVICYTNHALDQFLEALLPVTRSIVRVGGQSRNKTLEDHNLNKLRRFHSSRSPVNRMFYEQKQSMKLSLLAIKTQYERLDRLQNCVLSFETVIKLVPDVQILALHFSGNEDPLRAWLFEKLPLSDLHTILIRYELNKADEDDDIYRRDEVKLNEFIDKEDYKNIENIEKDLKITFSLKESQQKIRTRLSDYTKKVNKKATSSTEIINMENDITLLDAEIRLFEDMRVFKQHSSETDIATVNNVFNIPMEERWKLYFSWLDPVIDDAKVKIKPLEKPLEFQIALFEESRMMMDLEIIKDKEVIGMTTTGAARLRTMLQEIAAPIVIVEEAAEVFEAHIVTSLTQHCKHLILIGDHQQLRPSAAYTPLARQYNMEVSLFERMILNRVHSCQLAVQHRMRPEIAALISPHIYTRLDNHPSVEQFPDVKGMCNNLFFFTHNYPEEQVEESSSKSNHAEADLVLGLANYLMQQGYKADEVTVLAAYSGQMFYMRTQRRRYTHLAEVKITVVDNYQGEESKIILLSLVRNNSLNKIGFLGIKNRICVALSRAREGLYIFGNMNLLKYNCELWSKIDNTLKQGGNIGTKLRLKCQRHPYQLTTITKVQDFKKVPDGGCELRCDKILSKCGHQCPLLCHGHDENHEYIECLSPCERKICDLDHPCPLKCNTTCAPCVVPMKRALPCGHTQTAPCHEPVHLIKCTTIISVVLSLCGHKVNKQCHVPDSEVQCPVPCGTRIDTCGHACQRTCHLQDDPEHLHYVCKKPCARAKNGCTAELTGDRGEHQCRKNCYEPCDECNIPITRKRTTCKHSIKVACNADLNTVPCNEKCARMMPCGHFCKRKCHEPCGGCTQMVKKQMPDCRHEIVVECQLKPTAWMCNYACERKLPCGHECGARCGDVCDPASCRQLTVHPQRAPCGHDVFLPCNIVRNMRNGREESAAALRQCTAPCGSVLACGHECSGTCNECAGGALHVPCTRPCQRVLVCGHTCDEPCSQVCPPCPRRCELRCSHSRCANQCGVPCTPCMEPCSRICVHDACEQRCGEQCTRPACSEPCTLRIACGHVCMGVCGEPCPTLCRVCDPASVPKDFIGDDYDEDARFVKLADCPHLFESSELDQWVRSSLESEHVTLPACPTCRCPLLNTARYQDVVTRVLRDQINPIKTKLFGTKKDIDNKNEELKTRLLKLLPTGSVATPYIMKDNSQWTKVYKKIKNSLETNKKNSLLEANMKVICVEVLDILASCYDNFMKEKLTELKSEILAYTTAICLVLDISTSKLSKQQQMDINNEIKRINSVLQLSRILTKYPIVNLKKDIVAAAKNTVLLKGRFDEEAAVDTLRTLQQAAKASVTISKMERSMVVKAMGTAAGHWYKCPAGHPYYIGECGGATQEATCNECGARVGGTRHTLRADNAHAPEMDGSRYPAWSDMANINNYQL